MNAATVVHNAARNIAHHVAMVRRAADEIISDTTTIRSVAGRKIDNATDNIARNVAILRNAANHLEEGAEKTRNLADSTDHYAVATRYVAVVDSIEHYAGVARNAADSVADNVTVIRNAAAKEVDSAADRMARNVAMVRVAADSVERYAEKISKVTDQVVKSRRTAR